MAKLFKWLMVLFIPLLSLTLTSCRGDDEDEPDAPGTNSVTASFLIGSWEKSINGFPSSIIIFNDGTYESVGYDSWASHYKYVTRGKWSLMNRTLVFRGNQYREGEYDGEFEATFNCSFDDYTQKLVLRTVKSTNTDAIPEGNYAKIN